MEEGLVEGTPFGRYRLLEMLGRGGMGEVWRAHDTMTERLVAVKVLPPQWAEDEVFQQRFRREAHAAASLNEPHVVPIHDYGEIDGRLYVEMRLIEGRALQTVIADGPLVPSRAVAIIEQVAQALDAVHRSGLIHRDVKPSNILIARYDFAYLIDFGIARATRETGLTSSGHFVGTLHYMAPERFRGDDVDARSDVYALACVLQQCLTGRPPYHGDKAEQQVMAHLTQAPPRPSAVNPGLPSEFDEIIAKGMAKDRDERYQSAVQLAEAARGALDSAAIAAHAKAEHADRPPAVGARESPDDYPLTVREEKTRTTELTASASGTAMQPDSPVDAVPSIGTGGSINDLLDRAVSAINRGDRAAAAILADRVLALDDDNADAEDLLGLPTDAGEIRRLTFLSTELIDPTALAMRLEPEVYRRVVGRYRDVVTQIAGRYDGHVSSKGGEALLVVFGYPNPHEDDVRRAVLAGLEITREGERLGEQAKRRLGVPVHLHAGVHRGVVYLDSTQDDVFGLAANLALRVSALAPPGAVVISDSVEPLVRRGFELQALAATPMDSIDGSVITPYQVIGERVESSAAVLGPLVGRDRELARLEKSWTRAQAGTLTSPGVVFRGEPGIGKSRLAAAAAEIVSRDGGAVVELAGSPVHPNVGLHPVRTLLERRCGINRLTEPGHRVQLLAAEVAAQGLDAETAVPLLAPVLGIVGGREYEPVPAEGRKLQQLIAEAVKTYLLSCFGGSPGLLLVEDAHWFDPSTLELLGAVLGATGGRLLVVITGRPGQWLPGQWPAKVFDLTLLTDEQSDELIRALNPAVTPEECAAVRARCDGVPFYIEQVTSGLDVPTADNRPPVPDPLYEPLFARLLATPNAAPVVEAAAIIGRRVERGLLVAVSSLSEDEVDDVVDELEDARVLEPHGTNAWRFRHELLREVAAELAPPSVRRGLHGKVADALLDGATGDPDWHLVATHYVHAERYGDAATAYQKTSADARLRGALDEAREYLTRAIEQLQKCPAGPDRDRQEIRPRLERGFLASAAEGYQSPSVAADFERCLQLIGTDLSSDDVCATLLALVSYYVPRADLGRAAQLLELLRGGTGHERRWFLPAIETGLGVIAYLSGQFDAARGHFDQVVAMREDEVQRLEALWFIPDDPIVFSHGHLGNCAILRGDVNAAAAHFTRAVARADRLPFPQGPYNHVNAMDLEILMRVEAGQYDIAANLAADLLEMAERYGFEFWQGFGLTEQSMISACKLLANDTREPAALAAQIESLTPMVDLWRSVGLNAYQTQYDCVIARLLTAAGRIEEARSRIEAALDLADETGMHCYDAELQRARAHTHSDPDAQAADLAVALQLARHQGAPLFELRATLDDVALRGEPAKAALAEALSRMPEDCALPEAVRAAQLLG